MGERAPAVEERCFFNCFWRGWREAKHAPSPKIKPDKITIQYTVPRAGKGVSFTPNKPTSEWKLRKKKGKGGCGCGCSGCPSAGACAAAKAAAEKKPEDNKTIENEAEEDTYV